MGSIFGGVFPTWMSETYGDKGITLLFLNFVKVLLYHIRIYPQIYDCVSDIILYLCDYEKVSMGIS